MDRNDFWDNLPVEIRKALLHEGALQNATPVDVMEKAHYIGSPVGVGRNNHALMLGDTSLIYGINIEKRLDFWKSVLTGNYKKFYNLPGRVEEHIIDGQKFMI